MELRAKARRVHARNKLGLIIVDYLQLLSPTDSQGAPRAAGGGGFPRIKGAWRRNLISPSLY
jgi:replicative DNA helicase